MSNVTTDSLPGSGQTYFYGTFEYARAMLGNFAVSAVTGVSNYLFSASDEGACQPAESPRLVQHLAAECPPTNNSLSSSGSEGFYSAEYPDQQIPTGNVLSVDATNSNQLSGSNAEELYENGEHVNSNQPGCYFPDFSEASGPKALPYMGSAVSELLDADDESYPDENSVISSAPRSIDPKSLHCFETDSMVYIPGEFEMLDIGTVEIKTGSRLAQQLGVSGKVAVDKVFYEAGSGAVIAQVVLREKAYSFTLFYIKAESELSFTEAQELANKRFLKGPKQNVEMIYEVFRNRLKKKYSRNRNDKEYEHLLSVIDKKKPARPSIRVTKQYHCNNDVRAVTSSKGHDIAEALKCRMYQEEERLARNPKRLNCNNRNERLNLVWGRKKEWDATKRTVSRLCVTFASH